LKKIKSLLQFYNNNTLKGKGEIMKKLPLCISVCAAAFIIGCGGATGDKSDNTNASVSVSVSGQTTDEILVNADVTVYAKKSRWACAC
jgi:hypothetical protein